MFFYLFSVSFSDILGNEPRVAQISHGKFFLIWFFVAHWLFDVTPTINYSSRKRFLGKPFFYSWQQFSNFTLARVESVLLKEAVARRRSVKKVFLEISQNSQENTATLFKKRLWHRCFPVNFMKFLRTPFLAEHLRWVLLYLFKSYTLH